jgi:D-glycero-D-manno-heptose 1,7-bisphosphate phosphatase
MSNKAIFLDRDDTLIEDPGYINNPEQVKLLDGAAEALVELKALGYKLIVVSNQSAVARGIVTEKVIGEIHERLKQLLAEKKAYLDGIYYCPYHPEGVVRKYRRESDWRKPNPGMLLAAAEEVDIDLTQSWMIGNSSSDIEAGFRVGCRTILINRSTDYKQLKPDEPKPDCKAVNIKEAANIIKKYHRSPVEINVPAQSALVDQTKSADQVEEHSNSSEPPKPQAVPPEPNVEPQVESQVDLQEQPVRSDRSEQLLKGILEQLKSTQRNDMFGEFSMMRLIAGIVQIVVLFCLLITVWLLMSPNRQDGSVLIALGFAMVLQLMSLTFYIMQGRK